MANLTDLIAYGAAGDRPAAGVPGRLYYASDTDVLSRDNGSTWDNLTPAASAPSPVDWSGTITLTQSGAVNHTVTRAFYMLVASNWVLVDVALAITGDGTGNNAILVAGLPAAIQDSGGGIHAVGAYRYYDASTGVYSGAVQLNAGTTFRFLRNSAFSLLGVDPNFACANTDNLEFCAQYYVP